MNEKDGDIFDLDEYFTRRRLILGEILPEILHDINNYLSVILNHAEIEMAEDRKASRHLKHILESSKQVKELTRKVLTVTRPSVIGEAGNISSAVNTVLDLFYDSLFTKRNIKVTWIGNGDLPPVTVPTGDLQLVLINIVRNAAEALENADKREIRISAKQEGYAVKLEIWNSGPPIPEAVLPNVFSSFVSTKNSEIGVGLGLSIASRIIARNGGSINVENISGGVIFKIILPVAGSRKKKSVKNDMRAGACLGGRSVLIVDDEVPLLEMLGNILSSFHEAHVETCETGSQALNLVKEKPYDVVVLDMRLPGLSGQSVFTRLPEELKKRVVFITGFTLDTVIREFVSGTFQPIVYKPFESQELVAAIEKVLPIGK